MWNAIVENKKRVRDRDGDKSKGQKIDERERNKGEAGETFKRGAERERQRQR